MEQDLMQTQTGGEGNTIQSQDANSQTPEQFDVKINPIEGEPNKPVATVPTEQQAMDQQASMSQGPIVEEPKQPVASEEPVVTEETIQAQETPVTQGEVIETTQTTETTEPPLDPLYSEPVDVVDEDEIAELGSNVAPVSEEEIEIPISLGVDPNNPDVLVQAEDLQKEKDEYKNTAVSISPEGKVIVKTKPKVVPKKEVITTVTEREEAPVKEEPKVGVQGNGFYTYGPNKYKYYNGVWYKDVYKNGKYIKVTENAAKRTAELNKNAVKIVTTPKVTTPKKPGLQGEGFYTYGPKKDKYKYYNGAWYKDVYKNGNYIKVTQNAAKRTAELNKGAVKIDTQKSAVVNVANSIIQKTHGDVGDFAKKTLLTAGGDVSTAKGLSFNQLTKSNIPSKTEMYTQDGYVNFNYNPDYAKATPAAKVLIDASTNVKPVGKDLVNKVVSSDWSEVSKRIGIDNSKSIFIVDKDGNTTLNGAALLQAASGLSINVSNEFLKQELNSEFEKAKNFADKDIMYMFGKDDILSPTQREDLIIKQREIKKILGDGEYSDLKAGAVQKILQETEEYFNTAKEINTRINEAYSKDMSLDRYALEEKRKDYMNRLNLDNNTDFQKYAGETFESTLKLADFIQDGIEDGKLLYDRVNGGYKFSENITPVERKYYEGELSKMITDYNTLQDERFASVNSEIYTAKSELRNNIARDSSIDKELLNVEYQGERFKELYKEKYALKLERQKLEKEIDNKESLKSTVFLTEPKKLAASLNPTNSAKNIFNAIPTEITPKQKFDLFYKKLSEKNDELAKKNGIDTGTLSEISRGFKDMLDWGGYFSLSDAEKEYVQNLATLNKMAPLYFNNDFGFTQSSGGFFESFMNGFGNLLMPVTGEAAGYFSQSKVANDVQKILEDEGFGKDDIVDDNYINALKAKANTEFWSAENWGNMLGTTAGIMAPLLITKAVPSSALRIAGRVENLVTKTKNAESAALYLKRAEDVFDTTLKSTKYGKYLVSPLKTAAEFEITGRVFGSTEDEMYFLSGLTGGLASEGFATLMAKMPAGKAYSYIQSMFGSNTDKAVNVIKKIGEVNARGLTETAEEFGNELSNIYTDELRDKGFFEEVGQRFGTLDKVQEFVISTYIMGAGFGIVDVNKQKAAYEALSDEKKKQVDEVLNSVREDINSAESKVDQYVDAQNDQNEKKAKVEKEPEIDVKTTETGGIEFDVNNIEKASEGTPSTVDEARENPSSFTEPIDILDLEKYDKENEQGLPGEVREGQEPKQAEPVAETSQEKVSPSGVVQEKQAVTEEQKQSVEKELNEIIAPFREGLQRSNENNDPDTAKIYEDALNEFESNPVSFIEKLIDSPASSSEEKVLYQRTLDGLTKARTTENVENYSSLQKKNEEASNVVNEIENQIVKHYKDKGVPQNIIDELLLFGDKSVNEFSDIMPEVANAYDNSIADLHKKWDEGIKSLKSIEDNQQSKIINDITKSFEDFGVKGIGLKSVADFFNTLLNNSGFDSFAKKLRSNDFEDLKKDLVLKTYKTIAPDKFMLEVDKYDDIPSDIRMRIEETVDNAMQRFKEILVGEQEQVQGKLSAPKMGTTAPTTANPFTELESTKGLKGTAKTKAVKDLKQKYGADYNRISKIDTNFASIVRDLEKNNLIEKDCG
jgi:hypothetical protein